MVSTAQPPADHPCLCEGLVPTILAADHEGPPGVALTRVPRRGPGTQHGARDEVSAIQLKREKLDFQHKKLYQTRHARCRTVLKIGFFSFKQDQKSTRSATQCCSAFPFPFCIANATAVLLWWCVVSCGVVVCCVDVVR